MVPPQDGKPGCLTVTMHADGAGLYHEIGQFKGALDLDQDLQRTVNGLGLAVTSRDGEHTLHFMPVEVIAKRVAALNGLLSERASVIDIYPYNGPEMEPEEYLGHLCQDRLPISTGRATGGLLRKALGGGEYPHLGVGLHDLLVHWVTYFAITEFYRGKVQGFLREALDQPEEQVPYNGSGFMVSSLKRAMDMMERNFQLPGVNEAFGGSESVARIAARGILGVLRVKQGEWGPWNEQDRTELEKIQQQVDSHLHTIAEIIDLHPDIFPAVLTNK